MPRKMLIFHTLLLLSAVLCLPRAGDARTRVNVSGAAAARGANVSNPGSGNLGAATGTRSVDRGVDRGASVGSVDRDVNRNVNRDVDRDLNVDVDNHGLYHPWATAAVVGAGAAFGSAVVGSTVVGSTYWALPPSCGSVMVNGVAYQQCGSSWYMPQYAGTSVNYVAVSPPR